MQTFYQPFFSNSPLAILLQQFPFSNSFSLFSNLPPAILPCKSIPHPKSPPSFKKPKALHPPSVSLLYPVVNKVEHQFSERDCDTVTRGTCIPASLNIKQLRESSCSAFSSSVAGAVPISAYR
jgi:hypothetical protein